MQPDHTPQATQAESTQPIGPAQPPFKPRRFVALFVALYLVFHGLYLLVPDKLLRETLYPNLVGSVSVLMINGIEPNANARAEMNSVKSRRAQLDIVRGCDGSGVVFIVAAATLAFATSVRRKLIGLGLGLVLVYVINQIRIVGLYFVVANRVEWFPFLHTYLAPTLIIVLVCLYFSWWTRWAGQPALNASAG